ncbi:hypothetical protein L596_014765 [Steinernema carpocapsae]|uniref:Uncharacterized protein n=1 Tax=Steinernema carpocapsae TaxID=34508 RepID=A0A4V6A2X1_STECR|nr:hypothetical protein L596_014765 [Steinernema carpocapsae]
MRVRMTRFDVICTRGFQEFRWSSALQKAVFVVKRRDEELARSRGRRFEWLPTTKRKILNWEKAPAQRSTIGDQRFRKVAGDPRWSCDTCRVRRNVAISG